jgi:hypothetical protein
VLASGQPVYSTITKEKAPRSSWRWSLTRWYACEACARKEHPEYFPTAESLQLLLDKLTTTTPSDWEAVQHPYLHQERFPSEESFHSFLIRMQASGDGFAWNQYDSARERGYREHRRCARCQRPIMEPSGHRYDRWKRLFPLCCSSGCTYALRYAGRAHEARLARTPHQAVCAICGKKFTPKRQDARFCSNACRQSAYRQRS